MMEEILRVYQIFHNFALLKWFLTYLQRDHGIQALDYMHTCAVMAASDVTEYPELRSVLGPESVRKMSEYIVDSRSWAPFYRDVAEFTTRTWGLERSAVIETALNVQAALMPVRFASMPTTFSVTHDFVTYMADVSKEMFSNGNTARQASIRLDHYPPAELVVSDPTGICTRETEWFLATPLWSTNPDWQLRCGLAGTAVTGK
jgi:hypothetical protein